MRSGREVGTVYVERYDSRSMVVGGVSKVEGKKEEHSCDLGGGPGPLT